MAVETGITQVSKIPGPKSSEFKLINHHAAKSVPKIDHQQVVYATRNIYSSAALPDRAVFAKLTACHHGENNDDITTCKACC